MDGIITEQEKGYEIVPAEGAIFVKFDKCPEVKEFIDKYKGKCLKDCDYWVGFEDSKDSYFSFLELKHFRRPEGQPPLKDEEKTIDNPKLIKISEVIALKMICSNITRLKLQECPQDYPLEKGSLEKAVSCLGQKKPQMYFVYAVSAPFEISKFREAIRIVERICNNLFRANIGAVTNIKDSIYDIVEKDSSIEKVVENLECLKNEDTFYSKKIMNILGFSDEKISHYEEWISSLPSIKIVYLEQGNSKSSNPIEIEIPKFFKSIKANDS